MKRNKKAVKKNIKSFNLKDNFKNYSINKKIDVIFSFILIVTIISMIISIVVLLSLSSRTSSLYNGPYSVSQTISDIRLSFQSSDTNIYRAIIETNTKNKQLFLEKSDSAAEELETKINLLKNSYSNDEILIKQLLQNLSIAETYRKELLNGIKNNDANSTITSKLDKYGFQRDIVENYISKLYESSRGNAQNFVNSSIIYRNIAIIINYNNDIFNCNTKTTRQNTKSNLT